MNPPQQKYISKSSFMAGLDCPRKLWQLLWDRSSAAPFGGMSQLLMEMGTRFGVHAHQLYPGSTLIDVVFRNLTDRGTEYCGRIDHHDYQLYLAINDIDHTKTKAMSPQTNGICERFHKTILNEFYQVTFRKKLYSSMEDLQKDLDVWMDYYNNDRTHQGKMCCGRTPLVTLLDGKSIWAEKNLAQI